MIIFFVRRILVLSVSVLLSTHLSYALSSKDRSPSKNLRPAVPGNILVNYDEETSSPALPRSVINNFTIALKSSHLDQAIVQNQLDYLKARSITHITKENSVYWTDGKSRFLWRRYFASTWSDGLTLRHAVIVPHEPALVEILPVDKNTDVSLLQGFGQEPLLGFWQPLQQEYSPAHKIDVHKVLQDTLVNYKLRLPTGDNKILHCEQVYDKGGRLIKFNIDDDEFEYRNFKLVGAKFYLPRTVIWRKFSYLQANGVSYKYTLFQVLLNVAAVSSNVKYSNVVNQIKILPGAQIRDGRYKTRAEPEGISYVFDGNGTIDDASRRYIEDPYSAIPPDKVLGDPDKHKF